MLKDRTTLYIVIASLLILVLAVLIAYICHQFNLSRKKKKVFPSVVNGNKEVLEYDSLRFTYDTNIDPLQTHYPAELVYSIPSDGSTSSESNFGGVESESLLKSIDLIQPAATHSSKSSSECSELVDVVLVDNTNKSLRYLGKPSFLHHNGLGKLSAALFFDKTLEILRVNVIQWYNIGSKSNRSTLSPYVKVQLLPDLERKFFTKTKRGENPVFDEEFSFSVTEFELKDRTIHLAICDFDKFSRQNIIANGFIKLEEYQDHVSLPEGTGEFWIDLTESDEISTNNKGDISFSLSYFPTSNRITLTIVKAKNLDIEVTETRVAIKASLLFGDKVGKTRKTSYHQSDMTDPVFNESWVFDIPGDVLDQTSFLLCVYAYSHNKKRIIGTATAGSQVGSKTGLAQWNEMLLQRRDPILHWHKLV